MTCLSIVCNAAIGRSQVRHEKGGGRRRHEPKAKEEGKMNYCDVCGEAGKTVQVELANESGYREYCLRCAKENKRKIVKV